MGRSALTCCTPLEAPPVRCLPWALAAPSCSSAVPIPAASSCRSDLREFTSFIAELHARGGSDVLGELVMGDCGGAAGQVDEMTLVDQEAFRRFALRLGFRGDARAVFEVLDDKGSGSLPLAYVRTQLIAVDPLVATMAPNSFAKSGRKQPKGTSARVSPKKKSASLSLSRSRGGGSPPGSPGISPQSLGVPRNSDFDAPKGAGLQQKLIFEASTRSSLHETRSAVQKETGDRGPKKPKEALALDSAKMQATDADCAAPTAAAVGSMAVGLDQGRRIFSPEEGAVGLDAAPHQSRSECLPLTPASCRVVAPPPEAMLPAAWRRPGTANDAVGFPALDDGRNTTIVLRPLPYEWGGEDRVDVPRTFMFRGELITVPLLPIGTASDRSPETVTTEKAGRGTGWQKVRSNVLGGALRTIKDH